MQIENTPLELKPITCPTCNVPDQLQPHAEKSIPFMYTTCECGQKIKVALGRWLDHCATSQHSERLIQGMFNHFETGKCSDVKPGEIISIDFIEPIQRPGKVTITPEGPGFSVLHGNVTPNGMQIMASTPTNPQIHKVSFSWRVDGIQVGEEIPTWYGLLMNALVSYTQGLYKISLIEYATAVEVFVEQALRELLLTPANRPLLDFMLKKVGSVEQRVNEAFKVEMGDQFVIDATVKNAWSTNVQKLRNKVAHGNQTDVTQEEAYAAHRAAYTLIRWLEENLPIKPHTPAGRFRRWNTKS